MNNSINNYNCNVTIINNTLFSGKTCSKCYSLKPLTEFYKMKQSRDGLRPDCKECHKKNKRDYYQDNREAKINYAEEYYNNNKDHLKECKKEWYHNNIEYCHDRRKQYYEDHKEELSEKRKIYNANNKDKINKYYRNRYNNNPVCRLIENHRKRIKDALKNNSKCSSSIDLLGCSQEFYYNWISWQLPYEITLEEFKTNYHIDHVRPLSSFDMSIPENQYTGFNWMNCQPLLIEKNKSASLINFS